MVAHMQHLAGTCVRMHMHAHGLARQWLVRPANGYVTNAGQLPAPSHGPHNSPPASPLPQQASTPFSLPPPHTHSGVPCLGESPACPCHLLLPLGEPCPSSGCLNPVIYGWAPGACRTPLLPHQHPSGCCCTGAALAPAILHGEMMVRMVCCKCQGAQRARRWSHAFSHTILQPLPLAAARCPNLVRWPWHCGCPHRAKAHAGNRHFQHCLQEQDRSDSPPDSGPASACESPPWCAYWGPF